MLLLALVIGVSFPSFSWTQDSSLTIDGVKYDPDCSIQRMPLSRNGCPLACAAETSKTCVIRGIPYANASRFGRPQPFNDTTRKELKWKNEAVHCAQIDPFTGQHNGVENCLVVDLYYPSDWNNDNNNNPRNLIVLMEGIDFESSLAGYLNYDVTSDTQLAKHMLAVVHYRTGLFGFMTLQNQLMPANLGLWDQQMALTFLKNQTKALKVNNDFVLLGFGSGAVALHLHMLNPVSRVLFKRVLLSGGNALTPGAVQSDAVNTTLTLATRFNCDVSSMEAVTKCLLEKPTADLLTQAKVEPALRFATSVDASSSDTELENVFISAPLEDLVREQKIDQMEVVIHGYPALAGLSQFARNKDKKSENDVEYLANFFNMYSKTTAESVAKTVLDQYFQTSDVKTEIDGNPMKFINILTDFTVGYPIQSLVSRQVKQIPSNGDEKRVKLDSFVVIDIRKEIKEGEVVPSLASQLIQTKGTKVERRFGSTLDDMLLFVGCKDVRMHTTNENGLSSVAKTVSDNAGTISVMMTCLLDPIQCDSTVTYDEVQGTYVGQQFPKNKEGSDPHRFEDISRWSSVLMLASAMDRIEVENRALEREREKNEGVKSAGASFWGMLVGLIVLAVLSVLLIGILVKMVMDKRRATSLTPIEKPARSGAQYNVGMDSVTVEEGNRM